MSQTVSQIRQRRVDREAAREAELSQIARDVRYRDALHSIRGDVEELRGLLLVSSRAVVTQRILSTIDGALDLDGEYGGLGTTE